MAHITIIGGTGYAGGHIAREAVARGHDVTAWSRTLPEQPLEGVQYRAGSVLDDSTLAEAIEGADVVIQTVSPRGTMEGEVRPLAARLAAGLAGTSTRLGVIGGAGSLLVADGGPMLLETDAFPEAFKTEASELAGVLSDLRGAADDLDWFFVSPAVAFGAYAPGERTGSYRLGGDLLLSDEEGVSRLSGADLGVAVVDEIEQPTHRRMRFAVAN